jgi:hypothetical protein
MLRSGEWVDRFGGNRWNCVWAIRLKRQPDGTESDEMGAAGMELEGRDRDGIE